MLCERGQICSMEADSRCSLYMAESKGGVIRDEEGSGEICDSALKEWREKEKLSYARMHTRPTPDSHPTPSPVRQSDYGPQCQCNCTQQSDDLHIRPGPTGQALLKRPEQLARLAGFLIIGFIEDSMKIKYCLSNLLDCPHISSKTCNISCAVFGCSDDNYTVFTPGLHQDSDKSRDNPGIRPSQQLIAPIVGRMRFSTFQSEAKRAWRAVVGTCIIWISMSSQSS